jgi:hypothetical protein
MRQHAVHQFYLLLTGDFPAGQGCLRYRVVVIVHLEKVRVGHSPQTLMSAA